PLPGKLGTMSLRGQVASLAVWPLLELLLMSLVGLVDTAIAGQLSPVALDAIGVAAYVGWLLGMLHSAVGVGAGALIGRLIGGGRKHRADAALGQALMIATAWGIATGVTIAACAGPIASVFRMPPPQHELVVMYLVIFAAGSPLLALLSVGNAALKAAGDTRTPFLTMAVANVVNVGASLLFVYGPDEPIPGIGVPIGGYGVGGIAMGTVVAWAVGAAITLSVLKGWVPSPCSVRLHARWLRPRRKPIGRIVKVALPALVESSGMWIGNAIIGGFVGVLMAREGVDGLMAAHIVAIRLESLSFLPGMALGIAAATLGAQYLGAGRPDEAARAIRLCWLIGAGLMAALGVLFLTIPHLLVWPMAPGEEMAAVREQAAVLLMICGPVQLFFGSYLVLSQALRGAGDTRGAMTITYASTFGVRLPLAWFLAFGMGWGLTGMWFGLCGELVVRGVLFIGRFQLGPWRTMKVAA
ncbi:MAG: MATE family efflux transporter, partial [Planctomycetota bacterium]